MFAQRSFLFSMLPSLVVASTLCLVSATTEQIEINNAAPVPIPKKGKRQPSPRSKSIPKKPTNAKGRSLLPHHIDHPGTLLRCRKGSICTIYGDFGNSKGKMLLLGSLKSSRPLFALVSKWERNRIQFKIPRGAATTQYALTVTNPQGRQALSNSIALQATGNLSSAERQECKRTGDSDSDGHLSIRCGGDDCDDGDANRFPGNVEVCDANHHDEDCDPATYGFRDHDNDGYIESSCCNREPSTNSLTCGNDCNDNFGDVHPNQPEVCNHIDDNCNGQVDEGVTQTAYPDRDHDLFGTRSPSKQMCPQDLGQGWVSNSYDCNDRDPKVNPIGGGC